MHAHAVFFYMYGMLKCTSRLCRKGGLSPTLHVEYYQLTETYVHVYMHKGLMII